MMIMAYATNGLIPTDRVPPRSTVTAAYNRKFLQDVLPPKICQKFRHVRIPCPHFARKRAVSFLRCSIVHFRKVWMTIAPHSPCSPDMLPPAFDLLPKLKKPLHGKRYRSIEEVSNEVTRVIGRINNKGVLTGIQHIPKRWTVVIKHNGDYIEAL